VWISLPAVLFTLVEHTVAFWFFLSRVKNVCGVDTSLHKCWCLRLKGLSVVCHRANRLYSFWCCSDSNETHMTQTYRVELSTLWNDFLLFLTSACHLMSAPVTEKPRHSDLRHNLVLFYFFLSIVLLFFRRVMFYYRGAEKSIARPGRTQANVSVRMAWISFGALPCRKRNLMTTRLSMLLKSRVSLTCFRACFLPGRAIDFSAPR